MTKTIRKDLVKLLFIFSISTLITGCFEEEPQRSSEKDFLEFKFLKSNNPSLDQDYTAIISGTSITADLPSTTLISSLKATFSVSEKATVKIGNAVQSTGLTSNDFTQTKIYTVVAEDNSEKNYEVNINRLPSTLKDITEFKFLKSVNSHLDQDYSGTISENKITVNFPHGFSTNLIATFSNSTGSSVKVSSTIQSSGQTPNDFNQALTYTVTAEDNSSKQYTISLTKIGVAPNPTINSRTSYTYELNSATWINYNSGLPSSLNFYHGGFLARAFYDFDKDGDDDILMGNLNFDDTGLLNSPRPVNYVQNNNGTYSDQTSSVFSGNVPGQVHPRKAILGDFDNNGWMDAVFAGHGFDKPPFPGEKALLMMNNNGKFTYSYLSPGGFFHSISSGDIDNDGDLDLFFTENYQSQSKFFVNNGSGQFTYDNSIFPSDISNLNYFTSELYDLNNDGYLDLVIAGHTHENAAPLVLWGNYTGKYSKTSSSSIPSVTDWEIIIDINFLDINGDGLQDIILNRQGDGTGSQRAFYGLYVQLLIQQSDKTFKDNTNTLITGNPILTYPNMDWFWVDWLRIYDFDKDGKKDIVTDNKFFNIKWKNTGSSFTRE